MRAKVFDNLPPYDPNDPNFILVPEELPDGRTIQVIYRKGKGGKDKAYLSQFKDNPGFNYIAEFNHRSYEAAEGITCMQDECCVLRDGVKIYADIYLPRDRKGPFPLIMSWGPFGKRPSEGMDDWKLMGVPPKTVSTMAR